MPQPIPMKLTATLATRLINERAKDTGKVRFTHHAEERMELRGIIAAEVYRILREGTVYVEPRKNERNDWQAEIERRMPGGRDVAVITVIPHGDGLIIKTVMWRD